SDLFWQRRRRRFEDRLRRFLHLPGIQSAVSAALHSNGADNARTSARCLPCLEGKTEQDSVLKENRWRFPVCMAESEGFEPPIPVKVCRFSRPVPSTARPTLHWKRNDD